MKPTIITAYNICVPMTAHTMNCDKNTKKLWNTSFSNSELCNALVDIISNVNLHVWDLHVWDLHVWDKVER